MAVEVLVSKATDLTNLERIGKSDPYVELVYQGAKKKSQVISGNLNPEWNEKFVWEVSKQAPGQDESLSIRVKDYERMGRNRLMGETTLLLRNAIEASRPLDYALTLLDANQRPTPSVLYLTVTYQKPEKGPENADDPTTSPEAQAQRMGVVRPGAIDAALSTKKKNFQVRVKVVEARQLAVANANPICQVTVGKVSKQTKVTQSTVNPWWNEVFFFKVELSPVELYSEQLHFQVNNARAFRSNTLIGVFQVDLGLIYEQPDHAFVNKWMLLSSTDDSMPGIMGYLKASVAVLGQGDHCPDLSTGRTSEDDDVESNLLLPSGITLKPATLSLGLYQGSDLPRMDTGIVEGMKKILNIEDKKELIDPYVEVVFAGNKVTSKIIYGDDNPRWNETLFLGFQFPSVCDKLHLVLKDWDRMSEDDIIATANVPLSLISAPGDNGYLPTFGPSWVNLYGAPRQFQLLGSDCDGLNTGEGEGCAYRGRALVSLRTILGTYPERPTMPLSSDDILRVQLHCRRRRFRLHATFLDASMVSVVDTSAEFEVSIGNFGNKFEDTLTPSPSTTQPTNAVFDGCQNYFLPWKNAKPSIVVTSQWEDITFRLEAVNLLNNMADNLGHYIQTLRRILAENRQSEEQLLDHPDEMTSVVERIVAETKIPLPEPQPGQLENELDRLLRRQRTQELEQIRQLAEEITEEGANKETLIQQMEIHLSTLRHMAVEPQNSIPDVVIWMLSDKKRIAYRRIPAQEVLFSPDPMKCGRYSGKLQTIELKYPKCSNSCPCYTIPALLRVKLWLGLEMHEKHWRAAQDDAEMTVFAETYENQVNMLGKWTAGGPLMTRPSWSDSSGTVKLERENFAAPRGWRFEGDWFIDPEPSTSFDDDAGRRMFLDDVFENQNRLPGGKWINAPTTWTDVRGDPATPREEIEAPPGWEYEDVWAVDLHRAVDEEGWEYTVEATLGGYHPVEKTYHLCRRRRWVRQRKYVMSVLRSALNRVEPAEPLEDDGWEFSTLFNLKFHSRERRMDLVRRRRWHRKLVAEDPTAPLVLSVASSSKGKLSDDAKTSLMSSPRMYWNFQEAHRFQLRVYLYQARDLLAGDKTGFSDPYCCVSFLNQSQKTEVVSQTLCPTWDQTLVFEEIIIYGRVDGVENDPPPVVVEVYDRDAHGGDEFLGRAFIVPVAQLNPSASISPRLSWRSLQQGDMAAGEILASFELFLADDVNALPFVPPKKGDLYMVPTDIRPVLQLMAVEILCWGVRNMKTYEMTAIAQPSVEFEIAGKIIKSKAIKNSKSSPNFPEPLLYTEMLLPLEEDYMPPVHVRVRDNRQFGRKPIVGTSVVPSLHSFRCQPLYVDMKECTTPKAVETVVDIGEDHKKTKELEEDNTLDWWSKYYASVDDHKKAGDYLEKGYDTLQVFSTELEKIEPFNGFMDFLSSFSLQRGKASEMEESDTIGEFKGTMRVYPLPSDPDDPKPQHVLKSLCTSTCEEVVVRVYVIRGIDLAPKDPNGRADPYVKVHLGRTKMDKRSDYRPNTLYPVFGQMFELSGVLPLDKDLVVSVWDYDALSSDDLIGETTIDLENRYLTKFRATCGLPATYQTSGINAWRDCKTPKDILWDVCRFHHKPPPQYVDQTTLVIGDATYSLSDFEKEPPTNRHLGPKNQRLALHVLNQMQLVPEHIESRPLYNPLAPGLEQGKLEMWVDVFPKSHGTPGPAIDITPRVPLKYELRVVIWNTHEVPLTETSVVAGEQMSDIYVKSWLDGVGQIQKTDVHYRSMDGEGNFNWRFLYPFEYLPAEGSIVVKRKEHFWSLDATETRVPGRLVLQVWDNDIFSADDFIGSLTLDLTCMPKPTKSVSKCGLHQIDSDSDQGFDFVKMKSDGQDGEYINLFEKKRVKGFWPFITHDPEKGKTVAGKVEMELEILNEEEIAKKPAGIGRDEPNMNPKLDPPKRPATSFLWFASPWKSFKFIIWKNYKWYFITVLLIILALLLVILFIYSFPEAVVNKLVGN